MQQYFFPTYNSLPIFFKNGNSATLYDINNEKYIDFCAGLAVNSLGYNNQKIINALKKGAEEIWHLSNAFNSTNSIRLAEKIVQSTFADLVFFANSGAEATECAIKTIRMFQHTRGEKNKKEIIVFHDSFHGRTIGTMSASSKKYHHEGFLPLLSGFRHAFFNNKDSVMEVINENTAGIIIEPIQGNGGVVVADIDFLKFLRNICDEKNMVLCFDEIQCGASRTGKFLASDYFDVCPDITTLAKGICSGLPVSACIAKKNIGECMNTGVHGSTYGGNPLLTGVSNVVIEELLKDSLLNNVATMGHYLREKLNILAKKMPHIIKEVRGVGLLIGLEINADYNCVKITKEICKNKVLVSSANNSTIRITPPLIITKEEIDSGVDLLESALLNACQI